MGSIASATTMGAVGLIVADLNRSLAFYTGALGLHVQRRTPQQAWLGADGPTLLVLTEQPGAKPVQRGHTGLYHVAYLLPSRTDLARTLRHLIETRTVLSGASDHGVSEALYLSDPDGHGIEIYRDRPRSEWPSAGGALEMTLDPLDAAGLLQEIAGAHEAWHGMAAGTRIGHVHLHVRDIKEAETFYCTILGFDLMQRFAGQASFVSAGGYHHHLGLNVWAGVGAPPPPDDAARLHWYEILLPDADAYAEVLTRLRAANVAVDDRSGVAALYDPAGNPIRLIDTYADNARPEATGA